MKIIYLASYKALHSDFNIDYQDIDGKRDLDGDMLDIDLSSYDLVIATPPCNYWSRANYRRETSEYSQKTKHLLPSILNKVIDLKKPFIIENVRNAKQFSKYGLFDYPCNVYFIGRHTYWTTIHLEQAEIEYLQSLQTDDFSNKEHGWTKRLKKNSQGGDNVHIVIDYLLNKFKGGEN